MKSKRKKINLVLNSTNMKMIFYYQTTIYRISINILSKVSNKEALGLIALKSFTVFPKMPLFPSTGLT